MTDLPPRRKPYLIMAPEDRIGTPHIPVDPEKVVAIVESDYPDQTQPNAPEDDTSKAIATNLIEFLQHEVKHSRLPDNLLPLQSGIGNIANAVIGGLAVSLFLETSRLFSIISRCQPLFHNVLSCRQPTNQSS
jgi:acetyl-CoA hydrolase